MKKQRRSFFFSVRTMLTLSFLLLILLPYLLTSFQFTFAMQKQIAGEAAASLSNDTQTIRRGIDTMLAETQRVALLHLMDQDISQILRTGHSTYGVEYYNDEHVMQNAIKHATGLNTSILAVTFYGQGGNTYQISHIPTSQLDAQLSWLDELRSSGAQSYVAPMQTDSASAPTQGILPIAYVLKNSLGTETIGYVRVDYDLKTLWDTALLQCSEGNRFALFQDERLLWDTGDLMNRPDLLARVEDGGTPVANDVCSVRLDGLEYEVLQREETVSRLRILAYHPLRLQSQPAMQSIFAYLLVLGALLFADLAFSWLIAYQIGDSIKELAFAMDNAQHGQNELLSVSRNPIIQTELDQLRRSYNSMIDRLTLSAKREYTARVEQKNIAMRVLESQINPHFLYNALNLIASLAQLSHQDSIRSVSISLASILRYSIKGGSIVTLEEELSQTSHYINIIKLRFPDRIIIHTNIDSALLPCHVPKLLLQPLLENSCKYATDTAALTVIMEITIRAAGDGMLLTIADNGPGIPPDKLEEIQKRLANYDDNTQLDEEMKSLGLINVHARVRAHFGKPYGLTVASSENGCAVSIALPRVL